jgi:hypothetical protein
MNFKIIKSFKDPSSITYDLEDSGGKLYSLIMWDSGMFRIFNEKGEQAKYTKEESMAMLDAINLYKLKGTLTPKTQETFKDLIDEL